MRGVLVSVLLFLSGCASTPIASFPISDEVVLHVISMTSDDDSFQVKVRFEEHGPGSDVIQEGTLPDGATFVEKFPARVTTFTDTHHAYGLFGQAVSVRTMVVYTGETARTDDTFLGFAMLPTNLDGSVRTTIDRDHFNRTYNQAHNVQGRVTKASSTRGVWRIEWRPTQVSVVTPTGTLLWNDGTYTKSPPN